MDSITKFVGLDVATETISVTVADRGIAPPRYLGSVPNTPEAVRKLVRRWANRSSCWRATRPGLPATGWIDC